MRISSIAEMFQSSSIIPKCQWSQFRVLTLHECLMKCILHFAEKQLIAAVPVSSSKEWIWHTGLFVVSVLNYSIPLLHLTMIFTLLCHQENLICSSLLLLSCSPQICIFTSVGRRHHLLTLCCEPDKGISQAKKGSTYSEDFHPGGVQEKCRHDTKVSMEW